ncbi:hypothetical protein BBJ28_00017680 [Nothophytophthora sp. Chile5]|nr:hypothetical protein BBJ28_00017680 [Nothophytophthora sp. Chile5]
MFFQMLAMLLLTVGGTAAYMTKDAYGKPHFTSTHSWLAGATATLASLNMLGGLATTFGGKKTSWQWKNPGHRIGGTLAFLGGGAWRSSDCCGAVPAHSLTDGLTDFICVSPSGCSVVLGVYSGGWGNAQLGEDLQLKVAGVTAAAYSLLFLKLVVSTVAAPAVAKKKSN